MTTPSSDTLRPAFERLERLFADIWRTQDVPDYGGPRWFEFYRGSPIDEAFVCVDFSCNVLHVQRRGREGLTVTYIPGWFYEVVTRSLSLGLREDFSTVYVKDLALARPLRFELSVEREVAEATQEIDEGSTRATYSRLAFGYEFEPARAFAVEPAPTSRTGPVPDPEWVHWSAMKLRVVAAPGVRFTQSPLVSDALLAEARAVYVPHHATIASCTQALQFELERRQDPHGLPGLGARFRAAPLAETDLVAGSVRSRKGCALALEQTRPDGVDLLIARPGPSTTSAPWLAQLPMQLMRDVTDWFIASQGGIPPEAPLPIRIRVDPASDEDRFAYRLQYLDASGNPSAEPTEDVDGGRPCVRLSVKRTAGVTVRLDNALSSWGEAELRRIVEYQEQVVAFDDVPPFLHDDNDVYGRETPLEARAATVQDVLAVAYVVGEWVPLPAVEAVYVMRDLASLGTYLVHGRDVFGEEMTALDVGITIGGLLVPELGIRAVKGLARGARRLRTVGDDPFARLVRASEAVTGGDAVLAQELISRTAPEVPE